MVSFHRRRRGRRAFQPLIYLNERTIAPHIPRYGRKPDGAAMLRPWMQYALVWGLTAIGVLTIVSIAMSRALSSPSLRACQAALDQSVN